MKNTNPQSFSRGLVVGIALLLCLPSPDLLAAVSSRSVFATRKTSHEAVRQRNLRELDAKQGMLGRKDQPQAASAKPQGVATTPLSLASLQDLSAISIPPDDGQILEVWSPPHRGGQATASTVVLLQDLHTQPDAQQAEGRILQHLHKTYNLRLVASEGAEGPFQLEFFQQFPQDKQLRTLIAKTFLTVGEMTGHEYQAITEQLSVEIYGVEDDQLYEENGGVFRQVLEIAPLVHQSIGRIQAALDVLNPRLYPQPLQVFLKQAAQFQTGQRTLPEYVAWLAQQAQQQGLDVAVLAPNLVRLQQVQQLEAAVDRTAVETQLQQLLATLSVTLQQGGAAAVADELQALISQFQQQAISAAYFYPRLVVLAHQAAVDLSVYPALAQFVTYLDVSRALQHHRLITELEQVERVVAERLAGSEDAKTLLALSRHAQLLHDLFALRLTPEQLAEYQAHRNEFAVETFIAFLRKQKEEFSTRSARSNEKVTTFSSSEATVGRGVEKLQQDFVTALDAHLPLAERFYELAHQRDLALVENTLRLLENPSTVHRPASTDNTQGAPTAVLGGVPGGRTTEDGGRAALLIAGGFHTPGITALLRERQVSYVVITPTVSGELDEELYHRLVRGETMPVEEKIAAAHHLANSQTYMAKSSLPTANGNSTIAADEFIQIAIAENLTPAGREAITAAADYAAANYQTQPAQEIANSQPFQDMSKVTKDVESAVVEAAFSNEAKRHGRDFMEWVIQHRKILFFGAIAATAVVAMLWGPELVELMTKKTEVASVDVKDLAAGLVLSANLSNTTTTTAATRSGTADTRSSGPFFETTTYQSIVSGFRDVFERKGFIVSDEPGPTSSVLVRLLGGDPKAQQLVGRAIIISKDQISGDQKDRQIWFRIVVYDGRSIGRNELVLGHLVIQDPTTPRAFYTAADVVQRTRTLGRFAPEALALLGRELQGIAVRSQVSVASDMVLQELVPELAGFTLSMVMRVPELALARTRTAQRNQIAPADILEAIRELQALRPYYPSQWHDTPGNTEVFPASVQILRDLQRMLSEAARVQGYDGLLAVASAPDGLPNIRVYQMGGYQIVQTNPPGRADDVNRMLSGRVLKNDAAADRSFKKIAWNAYHEYIQRRKAGGSTDAAPMWVVLRYRTSQVPTEESGEGKRVDRLMTEPVGVPIVLPGGMDNLMRPGFRLNTVAFKSDPDGYQRWLGSPEASTQMVVDRGGGRPLVVPLTLARTTLQLGSVSTRVSPMRAFGDGNNDSDDGEGKPNSLLEKVRKQRKQEEDTAQERREAEEQSRKYWEDREQWSGKSDGSDPGVSQQLLEMIRLPVGADLIPGESKTLTTDQLLDLIVLGAQHDGVKSTVDAYLKSFSVDRIEVAVSQAEQRGWFDLLVRCGLQHKVMLKVPVEQGLQPPVALSPQMQQVRYIVADAAADDARFAEHLGRLPQQQVVRYSQLSAQELADLAEGNGAAIFLGHQGQEKVEFPEFAHLQEFAPLFIALEQFVSADAMVLHLNTLDFKKLQEQFKIFTNA